MAPGQRYQFTVCPLACWFKSRLEEVNSRHQHHAWKKEKKRFRDSRCHPQQHWPLSPHRGYSFLCLHKRGKKKIEGVERHYHPVCRKAKEKPRQCPTCIPEKGEIMQPAAARKKERKEDRKKAGRGIFACVSPLHITESRCHVVLCNGRGVMTSICINITNEEEGKKKKGKNKTHAAAPATHGLNKSVGMILSLYDLGVERNALTIC